MTKLSKREAERSLARVQMQRDRALSTMRIWMYLALAAVLTLIFQSLLWGGIYMLLCIAATVWTSRTLQKAARGE